MATLVTGADTPLGYAVARALLAAGQEVVALVAPEPRGPVCACLVATDGPHAGERFALGVGPAPRFVGRSAAHGEGGVCLGRDGSASGTHARLEASGADVVVADCGSTNGTLVDGRPVGAGERVPLRVGSCLALGATVLHVVALASERSLALEALAADGAVIVDALAQTAAQGVRRVAHCAAPLAAPEAERAAVAAAAAAARGGPVAASSSAAVYEGCKAARRGRPLVESEFLPRESCGASPEAAREEALWGAAAGRGDRGAGVVAVRLFDVYGGDADCGAAPAPGLASLARTLAGGGADERERTYCGDASHVSEAATWLVAALERAGHTRGFVAVNGAAGHLARGPDVARAASAARSRGEVGRRRSDSGGGPPPPPPASPPGRPASPRERRRAPLRADLAKMRALLGVAAGRVSVRDGLGRLLAEDRAAADRRLRHLKPLESRAAPSPASLVARVASFLLAPVRRAAARPPRDRPSRLASLDDDVAAAALAFCDAVSLAQVRAAGNWRARGGLLVADEAARRLCAARGWTRADARRRPFSWLYGRAGVWRSPVALASVGAAADETRSALTATRIGGAVYCFGGLDAAGEPTNDVRALALADATLGEWRPVATTGKPPAPRFGHGAAPWAGGLAIFGGQTALGPSDDLHVLALPDRAWSAPAAPGPRPPPRAFGAVACLDGKLVVWGGAADDRVWCRERPAAPWRALADGPNAPPPRTAAAACALATADGEALVVSGGRCQGAVLPVDDAIALTLRGDGGALAAAWAPFGPTSHDPRGDACSHHAAVALDGDAVLCVGGLGDDGATHGRATILSAARPPARLAANGSPRPKRLHAAARARGDAVLLFGGLDGLRRLDDLELLALK